MTTTKKYTVENFCKKYNNVTAEQIKKTLIEGIINPHYVPYEMKIAMCEKIVESSYYTTTEKNGVKIKKLHINSPIQYMLYCMNLIKEYTHIEIDFKNILEEFNLLNEINLLDIIMLNIPEKELEEFKAVLDMVRGDVMQNEYEPLAFITNQIERFGELFGAMVDPVLNTLGKIVANINFKDIERALSNMTTYQKK